MRRKEIASVLGLGTVILLPPDADLVRKKADQVYFDTYENEKPVIKKDQTKLGANPFVKKANESNLDIFTDLLFEGEAGPKSGGCTYKTGITYDLREGGERNFGKIYMRIGSDDLCPGSGLYACPEGVTSPVELQYVQDPDGFGWSTTTVTDQSCQPLKVGGSGWDKNDSIQWVIYNNHFVHLKGFVDDNKPVLVVTGADDGGTSTVQMKLKVEAYRLDFKEVAPQQ